jgi:hypothetical protein
VREIIAQRLAGKPAWLNVGSQIHALDLKFDWNKYGELTRIAGKSCFIKTPGSTYEERIVFSRHVIRVLSFEWNNVERHYEEIHETVSQKQAAEAQALQDDIQAAIRDRQNPKRKRSMVKRSDGSGTELAVGDYLHAYCDDWGHHTYGVEIDFTPKSCDLGSPFGKYSDRIVYAKHDVIDVLTEEQWATVDHELRRRQAEEAAPRESGRRCGGRARSAL